MKFRPIQALLFLAIAIILILGVDWGLPDARRMDVLFYNATLTPGQKSRLDSLTESYFEQREAADSLALKKFQQGVIPEAHEATKIGDLLSEEEKIIALRRYIVGSSAVDERKPYIALARMNPTAFDFNPRGFMYGGAYLYPLGASLFFMEKTGILTVTREMSAYIDQPGSIARSYIAGRGLNILAFLGISILLILFGRDWIGGTAGTFSLAAWSLSTLPLNQALVSKPHLYGAFWVFLGLYLLYRYCRLGRRLTLFFSAIAFGLGAGSSLVAAAALIFFPAFLIRFKELRRSFVDLLLVILGAGAAFVLTNPYILIHPEQYHLTIVQLGSAEGPGHAVFELKKGFITLRDFFFRSYSFPLAFAGGIGALTHLFRKPEPMIPSHFSGDSPRSLPILRKPRPRMAQHGGTRTILREPSPRSLLREPSYLRRLAVTWIILLLALSFTNGRVRHLLFLGPPACLLIGDALYRFVQTRGGLPVFLKYALCLLLFIPGIYFTILFSGDFINDKRWLEPVREWVQSADFNDPIYSSEPGDQTPGADADTTTGQLNTQWASMTLGLFDRPDPVYHPPFPFVGARIVNLHEYRGGSTNPDYVILGNFFDDRHDWENHPLHSQYKLTRDLGDQASLHRWLFFRIRSQSRTTGWIYKRATTTPGKNL